MTILVTRQKDHFYQNSKISFFKCSFVHLGIRLCLKRFTKYSKQVFDNSLFCMTDIHGWQAFCHTFLHMFVSAYKQHMESHFGKL